MRPSPPNSAVKRLPIVLPKGWPNPEPEGVVRGSQLIPLQNNHRPSAHNHCISWKQEILGLRHHALLFFGFHRAVLPGPRGVGARRSKQCSSTARCCSHVVSWQVEESPLEQDGQLRMYGGTRIALQLQH